MSIALLIARLLLGLGLASHGAQKVFGWFGGYGLTATGGYMETLGLRPGYLMALAAGLGEVGGGLLVALGFLGGLGPALAILVMLTAIVTSHLGKGYFTASGGWELPGTIIAGMLAIDFAGYGVYSLDSALGIHVVSASADRWIAIGIAVVLALGTWGLSLAQRRPATAAAAK